MMNHDFNMLWYGPEVVVPNNSRSPLITCNKYGLCLCNQTQTCMNPSVSRIQININ